MRLRQLRIAAETFTVAILFTRAALADECLDASERARAELQARHLLAARVELRGCAASTCEDAIRFVCEERLVEVTQRLATIVFDLKDDQGNDLVDVQVDIDGTVASAAPGTELTLDPGPHVFSFRWRERREERTFVMLEREKGRRETITFARPAPPAPPPPPPRVIVREPAPRPWRTAGFLGVAAGAVGLGIGTAFGIVAMNQNAQANCDASNICDDPRSRGDARTSASVSTSAFLVGGLIAAAGAILVLVDARVH